MFELTNAGKTHIARQTLAPHSWMRQLRLLPEDEEVHVEAIYSSSSRHRRNANRIVLVRHRSSCVRGLSLIVVQKTMLQMKFVSVSIWQQVTLCWLRSQFQDLMTWSLAMPSRTYSYKYVFSPKSKSHLLTKIWFGFQSRDNLDGSSQWLPIQDPSRCFLEYTLLPLLLLCFEERCILGIQ